MSTLLPELALRASALLLFALCASFFLRRASAASRHLLWATTCCALLLLPILSVALPAWRVLPRFAGGPVELSAPVLTVPGLEPPTATSPQIELPAPAPKFDDAPVIAGLPELPATRPGFNPWRIVALFYFAGVAVVLALLLAGSFSVSRLARRVRRVHSAALLGEIDYVARELNVPSVATYQGGAGTMPVTWGLLNAKLMLPADAHTWPAARLRAVLRHELAHVRRRDAAWQLIAEIACALYWFQPLVWYASRRMRIEREHACDDAVLSAGSRPSEYATDLLDIARSLRTSRPLSVAAIAMAQPNQLENRLLAVLDEGRKRAVRVPAWPTWGLAVSVLLPIAALQPRASAAERIPTETEYKSVAAEQDATTPSPRRRQVKPPAKRSPRTKVPAPKFASVMTLPNPQQQTQNVDRCFPANNRHLSINSNSNDGVERVKWETSRCKGTLLLRGDVRFHGDLSGIASISPGGEFRFTEADGSNDHEVVVRNENGRLVYSYQVDGKARSWDAKAQTWFAGALLDVIRRTGFAADERVDYLLKHGGLSAVLSEVSLIGSDYVQGIYLRKLIAKASLNGTAVATVIDAAARGMDSDYELAQFLIEIAKRYTFTDDIRRSFIAAAGTLDSDYEHRRALDAVLSKGGLSSADVVAMLKSAHEIDSDYERAELLIGLASRYRFDAAMRTAYLASAAKMDSDYETGRVFKTLIQKNPALSSADVDMIITASNGIDSDYERAELLLTLLARNKLSPEQRNRLIRATDAFDSEYEKGRVSTALLRQAGS